MVVDLLVNVMASLIGASSLFLHFSDVFHPWQMLLVPERLSLVIRFILGGILTLYICIRVYTFDI